MDFYQRLQADREIDVKFWRKHPELRAQLVDDAYQHKAHFIYELLQNAEDAGASRAVFELYPDRLEFLHNGVRRFTEEDIEAITDVSKSGKSQDSETIGKFGIGFKSVFQYTETPRIHSGTHSFMISDFVYPKPIPTIEELGNDTLFVFPFNSPRKYPSAAMAEIEAGLHGLAETTLLFLRNLQAIHWRTDGKNYDEVRRIQHSGNHIEVLRTVEQKTTEDRHFLHFSVPVENQPKQCVSIAFALDLLTGVTKFDPANPMEKQLKIVPTSGRVAVYFPAEQETSGLHFHLHAPCVTVLNRASIKETPANEPLFRQLARLAAASLHTIRDLNLLTGEFLGVLPNPWDSIPLRYQPIRTAIVEEMKHKPLTPTHAKAHAPAVYLRQAKASLKELLTEADLKFLVGQKDAPLQWAIGATQRNNDQDHFLAGLDIATWDISEFVKLLSEKCARWVTPVPAFNEWLAAKPVEWHQQMYSLLDKEFAPGRSRDQLKSLRIVRLSDGSYSTGDKCYFPSDVIEHDPLLPRVDAGVYTFGKNKTQQEDARKLLEAIGVREVGEAEQVESILKQRYANKTRPPDEQLYRKDIERFMSAVEKELATATTFGTYFIFKLANEEMGRPSQVFLDSPYKETGLAAYFEALGAETKKWALSKMYQASDFHPEDLRRFAEAAGAQTKLDVERRSTQNHRFASSLMVDLQYRVRWTDTAIDDDWMISDLELLLPRKSEALSRLVWETLCGSDKKVLKARFRPNQTYKTQERPSSLVFLLQETSWVPQDNGNFVRPLEASRASLPKGFPIDEGYEWLKAVRFGENERQQSEEHKKRQATARELGFYDDAALCDARQFAKRFSPEQRRLLLDEHERTSRFELPEHTPHNPDRRAERVMQQAEDAPERISEMRTRSVSVGREEVKAETEQYLREQYTNLDGEMICQACQDQLPFKLYDGSYYFEKVEFLPELQNRHYQNYLALCPNHAAMYQHANGSRDLVKEMFMTMTGNELEVILAQKDVTVYFTGTHLADLRAVIAVDQTDQTPG